MTGPARIPRNAAPNRGFCAKTHAADMFNRFMTPKTGVMTPKAGSMTPSAGLMTLKNADKLSDSNAAGGG